MRRYNIRKKNLFLLFGCVEGGDYALHFTLRTFLGAHFHFHGEITKYMRKTFQRQLHVQVHILLLIFDFIELLN